MSTAFAVTANNVSATVGTSGYTHGANTLVLTTGHGAKFPSLTGSQFYRLTVAKHANAYTPGAGSTTYTIFKATGLSTDTFTGLTVIEGTSATNDFASGDIVEVRVTAQTLSDIHTAVNAIETIGTNNPWVCVDDYGAAGDGSTNDTVSIQNALNTGKNVRFGAGKTYRVSGTLTVQANQTVELCGATIKLLPQIITTLLAANDATSTSQTLNVASTAGMAVGMNLSIIKGGGLQYTLATPQQSPEMVSINAGFGYPSSSGNDPTITVIPHPIDAAAGAVAPVITCAHDNTTGKMINYACVSTLGSGLIRQPTFTFTGGTAPTVPAQMQIQMSQVLDPSTHPITAIVDSTHVTVSTKFGQVFAIGDTVYSCGTTFLLTDHSKLAGPGTIDGDACLQQPTGIISLTGTGSMSNGTSTLTGSGTSFTTQVTLGSYLNFAGDGTNTKYKVASIASDTSLTLATNYTGTTLSGSAITQTETYQIGRWENCEAILLTYTGSYSRVVDVEVKNYPSDGIMVEGIYSSLENCYVHDVWGNGIHLSGSPLGWAAGTSASTQITGTATAPSGTTVTGSGTLFLTQVKPGQWIQFASDTSSSTLASVCYQVASVQTNTSLTLVRTYNGTAYAGGSNISVYTYDKGHILISRCHTYNTNLNFVVGHVDGGIIWSDCIQDSTCVGCITDTTPIFGFGSIDSTQNSDVTIIGCTMRNCMKGAVGGISANLNSAAQRISVIGNRMWNCGTTKDTHVIDIAQSSNNQVVPQEIVITGNLIDTTSSLSTGINLASINYAVVSGNALYGNTASSVWPGNSSNAAFITTCKNVDFTGNEVYGFFAGPFISGCTTVSVTGNTFNNQYSYSIQEFGGCIGLSISANTCQGSSSSYRGILVGGTGSIGVSITGNTIILGNNSGAGIVLLGNAVASGNNIELPTTSNTNVTLTTAFSAVEGNTITGNMIHCGNTSSSGTGTATITNGILLTGNANTVEGNTLKVGARGTITNNIVLSTAHHNNIIGNSMLCGASTTTGISVTGFNNNIQGNMIRTNVLQGSVSTLSGTALVGTGTVLKAQAPAGTSIIFGFDSTNTAYSVSSVASDTSLTLGSSYTGSAVADPKTISLGAIATGISIAASQGAGNVVLNNMIGTAGVTTDISLGASTTVNVTAATVTGNYRTV